MNDSQRIVISPSNDPCVMCKQVQPNLHAYATSPDRFDVGSRGVIIEHLITCDKCQHLHNEIFEEEQT